MPASVPLGGSATISASDMVPVVLHTATMPTSIARPPEVVTIRAVCAAPRLARRVGSWPISRYDSTVVSSQKTNISTRLSAVTSPSMVPAKTVRIAADLPVVIPSKYHLL